MKSISIFALTALLGVNAIKLHESTQFAPAAAGPYASDTDHLSSECYGADEDDIMYDVFERYRVEEKSPTGAGTGVWKLPKGSGPEWSADVIRRFNLMDNDKVNDYVSANFNNFWKKYDNNGTGEIYESEGETFMRALLGPNNRFRLAPGALSDMNTAAEIHQNQFATAKEQKPFAWSYPLGAGPAGGAAAPA